MDAALRQGFEDYAELVNPLIALRAELTGEPYKLARVVDGRLVDLEGRVVEDMLAGWGTQSFGHRNRHVEAALRRFLDGDTPSYFTSGPSPFAGRLARVLAGRTGYDAAFFAQGGTEAVEAAIKLARAATGRRRILCLEGAYHGCTLGSLAMMAPGAYRDPFGPHLPDVVALPFGDLAVLESTIADAAAVVVEPIQVESGVRALSPEYVAALGELTARHGVLLVADEIQTGLGRTGRFLASESWPRRPDVVLLAKALGGGLVPISAMLTRRPIFARAYGRHDTSEAHNSTFSGHALACVAALATLELLDEPLLAGVRARGEAFRRSLAEALAGHPLVRAVRGEGLLAGIELASPDHPYFSFEYMSLPELAHQPAAGVLLGHRLFAAGFLTSVCGHAWSTVRLQPPLTMAEDRLAAFTRACRQALDELWQLM